MTADDSIQGNDGLEAAMERASHGSLSAAEGFYKSFLNGPLFVPERYQIYPLSDSPEYPNDFINILGVQDKERAVVPVFSHLEHVTEWCGAELQVKRLNGSELLGLLPNGWWVAVNPGRDVHKELSPWELEQLRGGQDGLGALLEELRAAAADEMLSLTALGEQEHNTLKQALCETARLEPAVRRLMLMREEGFDDAGEKQERLLLGVEAPGTSAKQRDAIRDAFQRAAAPHLIGGDPLKIFVEESAGSSMMLGLFQNAAPLYETRAAPPQRSWWRKLLLLR